MTNDRQRAAWELRNLVRDLLTPSGSYQEVAPDLAGLLQALTASEINAVTRVVQQIRRHPWPGMEV